MILNITGPILLSNENLLEVYDFCHECKLLGYENNKSLKAMKWDEAEWFAHFYEQKIISLSGVQKFMDGYRIMFRGATLPGTTNKLLNKEQALSQIDHIGKFNKFYFTLNCNDHKGVKSNRLRSIVKSGRGWPGSEFVKIIEINSVKQEVWKI